MYYGQRAVNQFCGDYQQQKKERKNSQRDIDSVNHVKVSKGGGKMEDQI